MKKHGIGSRLLALLLVLAMVVPMVPMQAKAAVGDLTNVSTGLTGDINTGDTISLPIKILDYEADGMMFEFAEATANVKGVANSGTDSNGNVNDRNIIATEFGATWGEDYTIRTSVGGSVNTGNYWSDVSLALKTGTYANYTRMTWAGNTTANWTGNRAGVVMADFTTSSTYTTDQVRYMVVVFRSNVRSGNFTVGLNRANLNGAGTDGNYTGNIAVTTQNDTNWTYAVLDLKTGSLGSNWNKGAVYGVYVGLPIDSSGEWMDLAHVAFFSNKELATAFGEYALTDGSDRGDNRGFGLLRSSRTQANGTAYAGIIDQTTTVEQLNTYGNTTSIDFSTLTTLGYTLLGTFGNKGIANVGLLESHLSAEGYPVYKQEVVTYVANLLKHSLEISERTSDGWKNYRYVKGTASDIYGGTDLATALRTKIKGTMGSYAAASGKDLVGTWDEVSGNIASYYDAAYFLLNSIFVPGSYNDQKHDYDYLVLSAGTDSETGDKVYVFDGGFTTSATPASASMAIDYNTTNNTIQNTSAAGKTHFVYEGTSTTTLNPFLPIIDRNTETGMTINPYYQDDGVINGIEKEPTKDTLYKRNFNFAMVSEGQFTYHADDELFFEFEGDDDVYLFINDELVMDIGSAHSIDSVRFELNDYVNAAKAGTLGSDERNKALALEEGNVYSFKFYYMERHSYGSNIRINTNIRVTDPSMVTAKTAWQDGSQLDFGSIVDKDKVVEYGFAITNNGEENLYNLTFTDNDIGVKLDPTNGLKVTGERVYDVNGGTLEASDLTAIVSHPDYADITVTFADNSALMAFLATLASDAVIENGGGLWSDSTVLIRGIGYKLNDAQIAAGVFDNTVLTTATNSDASKTLQGQATMRVFVPADPMYYEWAGHDLNVTKTKLITDVLAAANQEGNILAGKVSNLTTSNVNKIELVTKAGTAITSPYVTIDGSYNLTINYPTAGSKVFYAKVTYNSSRNTVIVPVLVNVTDVEDSVYVLDYGLKVDLTDGGELFKNDAVTAPGRSTKYGILGIGTGGDYANNEISFSVDDDDVIKSDSGTFTYTDETDPADKIEYAPNGDTFLETLDEIQIAVNVYEEDITPSKITGTLDINNEVEMYKNITVLPATVVYYEDCFPAITYTKTDKTEQTNIFEELGSQSNDQDEEYGSDSYYDDDTTESAGALTTITIDASGKVAEFTFKGTGFELIGRTNAKDSATITVKVYKASDVTNGVPNSGAKPVKTIPVITEFDNYDDEGDEEIYQVPVVRVKDLTLGTYTVQISGVPARDYEAELDENGNPPIIPTKLYVDGLRIYQPLGAENENYNDTENGAEFRELRNDIVAGNVAVVEYSESNGLTSYTATSTWTENLKGEGEEESYEYNEANSVEDYLLEGPNNEVYMTGTYDSAALVFYVRDTNGSATSSLQIALRAIDEAKFFAGIEDANPETGVNAVIKYSNGTELKNFVTVEGSTEQYYTIDLANCKYADGRYEIILYVESGMVSFSSLKLVGLDLVSVNGEATDLRYDNGILVDPDDQAVDAANYIDFQSVRTVMATTLASEPDTDVTEPTEPEESEPEVTEPEVTEPEVTEPEVTEPEVTEPEESVPEETEPEEEENPVSSRLEQLKKLLSWLRGWMRP